MKIPDLHYLFVVVGREGLVFQKDAIPEFLLVFFVSLTKIQIYFVLLYYKQSTFLYLLRINLLTKCYTMDIRRIITYLMV